MGEKSVLKKQFIVDKARTVFIERGFKNVTMKDIVDACEISRGGLYLYFDSTDQIFLEVLRQSAGNPEEIFSSNLAEDATAADILLLLLQEEKKQILDKKDSLVCATYEFYFQKNKPTKKDNVIKRNYDQMVRIIEKLLEIGTENGEFYCDDPAEGAKNIWYTMEGLRITARTIGVNSETVDKQILYILTMLGVSAE